MLYLGLSQNVDIKFSPCTLKIERLGSQINVLGENMNNNLLLNQNKNLKPNIICSSTEIH